MIVLSSRFVPADRDDVDARVARVLDACPGAFEIGHPTTMDELRDFQRAATATHRQLETLHADKLLTDREAGRLQTGTRNRRPSPWSRDPIEVRAAVDRTRFAVDGAARVEVPAVLLVLPSAMPELELSALRELAQRDALRRSRGESVSLGEIQEAATAVARVRDSRAAPLLDGLRSFLDPVLETAADRGTIVELRAPAFDLAGLTTDHFVDIAQEFEGSTLRARFELGPAEMSTRLGFDAFDRVVERLKPLRRSCGLSATDLTSANLLFGLGLEPERDGDRLERVVGEAPVATERWVLDPPPETVDAAVQERVEYAIELGCEEPPPVEVDPFPRIGG